MTVKLFKKFGLDNAVDAFVWFRSHTDTPEDDDLHAKAFDLALQRLRVAHLDRRIFWSELDKSACGGITYEDFVGKLHFIGHEDPIDFEKIEQKTTSVEWAEKIKNDAPPVPEPEPPVSPPIQRQATDAGLVSESACLPEPSLADSRALPLPASGSTGESIEPTLAALLDHNEQSLRELRKLLLTSQ